MKAFIFITTLFLYTNVFCQETILKTKFAVRDFKIKENKIVYIEKRDIKSYNLITKQPDTLFKNNSFFIGGYGLNIFYPEDTNQIVTASNELIKDRSSIRFYNIQKKNVNKYHVYYTTELMDFLLIPEQKIFFLSKKNLTIEVFEYSGKPRYKKTIKINLDSYSRKLHFQNDKLYYITDSGKLFEYSIQENKQKLLYQGENILVNFSFDSIFNNIYISTFDGKVIKININDTSNSKELKVGNEIIEAIDIIDNQYIVVGDWSGKITVISIDDFEIEKEFENKKRIIKIRASVNRTFYTSDANKTIKKWVLN